MKQYVRFIGREEDLSRVEFVLAEHRPEIGKGLRVYKIVSVSRPNCILVNLRNIEKVEQIPPLPNTYLVTCEGKTYQVQVL